MAEIAVLMPAYKGADLIAESIRSVIAQSFQDWELHVSIDGPDPELEAVVASFDDPRIRITVQPERLGWPGNFNWLLKSASSPFVCYWQQDDFATTGYLEDLRTAMLTYPEAAIAYSDVQWFGDWFDRTSLPSIIGTPLERGLEFMEDVRYEPLRGLMRRSLLPSSPSPIPVFEGDSHQAEFVFLTEMAIAGDLIRTENSMYFKRKHESNAFSVWQGSPDHARRDAWHAMGAAMFEALSRSAPDHYHEVILAMVLDRLTVRRPGRAFWHGPVLDEFIEVAARDVASILGGLPPSVPLENAELMRPVAKGVWAALELVRGNWEGRSDLARRSPSGAPIAIGPESLGLILGYGWSLAEPWGVWSESTRMRLDLEVPSHVTQVELDAVGYSATDATQVTIRTGDFRDDIKVSTSGTTIVVPIDASDDRTCSIDIEVPDPVSPRSIDGTADDRRLGLGLRSLSLA